MAPVPLQSTHELSQQAQHAQQYLGPKQIAACSHLSSLHVPSAARHAQHGLGHEQGMAIALESRLHMHGQLAVV